MEFVRIAKVSDFDSARMKTFRVLARPVAVIKEPDGAFRAIEMSCKHQNADLSGGRMHDGEVTCPWHGWKYDLSTGECLWGGEARLRPYRVKVEDGAIYLSLRPVEADALGQEEEAY